MSERATMTGFARVAVLGRGESATRLVHALRELARESDDRIATIALHAEADRRARFVREADEALSLGTVEAGDAGGAGRGAAELDAEILEQALRAAGADALWVGVGSAEEQAGAAEVCARLGIVFLGPAPDLLRRLADPRAVRALADRAGVATAPHDAAAREDRAGIAATRRVRVPVVADAYGNVWAVGVGDGTIARQGEAVLEESPSPALWPAQDAAAREAALRLARAADLVGAAHVDLRIEPGSTRPLLVGASASLPLEHAAVEATSGVDLVKLQLRIARGARLEGGPPAPRGHAVAARLRAVDPERHFAPAGGTVELFRLPTGPGLRVDTGIAEGDAPAADRDPAIVRLTALGGDRGEALARLHRALVESAIAIRGGASDKSFLLALLERPEVRDGHAIAGFVDELVRRGEHVLRAHADAALVQAAIEAADEEARVAQAQFLTSAARGRPRVRPAVGATIELRYRGHAYRFAVRCIGARQYRLAIDGQRLDAKVDRLSHFESRLSCFGKRYQVLQVAEGLEHAIEIDGVPHRIARDAGGVVRSPTPAVVLAFTVAAGDVVAAGDRLAVLEAMKMEMPVLAPVGGRVRQIFVTANVQVDAGAPLLVLEPLAQEAPVRGAARIDFAAAARPAATDGGWARSHDELLHLMLGFDVETADARRAAKALDERGPGAADEGARRRAEDGLLSAFADIHALFRRQRAEDDVDNALVRSPQEYLLTYLRVLDGRGESLPLAFQDRLRRALAHYGIESLERTAELEQALVRIYQARERADEQAPVVIGILERRLEAAPAVSGASESDFQELIDRLLRTAHGRFPAIVDLAREVRHRFFDEPLIAEARRRVYARAEEALARLATERDPAARSALMAELVDCPQPLVSLFLSRLERSDRAACDTMLEALTRRYYRTRSLDRLRVQSAGGQGFGSAEYEQAGRRIQILTTFARFADLASAIARLGELVREVPRALDVVADVYVWHPTASDDVDATERELRALLERANLPRPLRRIVFAVAAGRGLGMGGMQHITYRPSDSGYAEQRFYRGLHPMMGKRMDLWRLSNFATERLPSAEDVYLFRAVAHENPKDERLFALAEVRDLTPVRDAAGRIVQLPSLEHALSEALAGIRRFQAKRTLGDRLQWNRVFLYVWPPLTLSAEELDAVAHRLAPQTEGLGLEQVVVRARVPANGHGGLREAVLRLSNAGAQGLRMTVEPPPQNPLRPLGEYEQKVVSLRRRGLVHPYELVRSLTPPREGGAGDFPPGEFVEYDLDESGALAPVQRPVGKNSAHLVVGVIRNFTAKVPDGMERVILLGDASKEMGSVAEPECRRIIAALDLARDRHLPLEWFALSAGAKISMESGTENMDWISRVLRRLIEFTQAGGEVNVVVTGINVGAQPYWNAEATMLMHTRGILVMTPDSAMVLTGKQALDYSGSVSAEDNFGIGGYDRIMGPNGQAQYFAPDLSQACQILLRHYDHTYVVPGESSPRRARTADPIERDVRAFALGAVEGEAFATVGEIFSADKNPGRKKPFDIRRVMAAVVDQDHAPLERWPGMRDAEIAVVWDAHLGGFPVCLIGIESQPVSRLGFIPADGPEQWTAGTLFPRSSKKLARSINAASGNRPLVVLANLSGFDGSPESMRELQLEYGAEIGRAVVNFKGPIVFCVVSRLHGGAFVVFSRALNERFEAAALEGAYASVIGGAPAAAVVFARDVDTRTRKDPRVQEIEREIAAAGAAEEKAKRQARLAETIALVRSEKLGEVADEFDHIHSVERALRVGSLDKILPATQLRPYLIDALERGSRHNGG